MTNTQLYVNIFFIQTFRLHKENTETLNLFVILLPIYKETIKTETGQGYRDDARKITAFLTYYVQI